MTRSIEALQAQGVFMPSEPKRLAWLALGLNDSAAQTSPNDAVQVLVALADCKKLVHAMLADVGDGMQHA